jgi:hypothetical protein
VRANSASIASRNVVRPFDNAATAGAGWMGPRQKAETMAHYAAFPGRPC